MTTFTREDFEMAAKAIGFIPEGYSRKRGLIVRKSATGTGGHYWNPRDDDGDALRLAVKIGLGILTKVNNAAHVAERCLGVCDIHQVNYGAAGDEFAATRHAIFRAAIAIGRAMPAPEVRPTEAPCLPPSSETAPGQQLETLVTPGNTPPTTPTP